MRPLPVLISVNIESKKDAQYLDLLFIGRKQLLFEIVVQSFNHFCPY